MSLLEAFSILNYHAYYSPKRIISNTNKQYNRISINNDIKSNYLRLILIHCMIK